MKPISEVVALTELDRRIWEEELEEFVPQRVFDAHTHIFRWSYNLNPDKNTSGYGAIAGSPYEESEYSVLDFCDAALMPNRTVHRLSFPFPYPQCDYTASNKFLAEQLAPHPQSAGLMLVHPSMTADEVEAEVRKYKFVGFKPYRNYSVTGDIDECRITDFMPEHQIAVANRLGLIIMMHVSKRLAIADAENQRDLRDLCERYPNVRWILAHCARSYSAWPIERAAKTLRALPNVWYDTSSVCESDAFDALYSEIGIERVMYGSDDVPVGVWRGKYIAWGEAWSFVGEDHSLSISHCDGRMTFTRYEQLRAMRRAAKRCGIRPEQNQDLFSGTAERLIQNVRAGLS